MSIEKMSSLVERLNHYRKEYYSNNNSVVSDNEYDVIFDELVELEKNLGIVLDDSPTKNVGYYQTLTKLKKVNHETPLLSLDKTKDVEKVSLFLNNKEYIIMSKVDGLTIKLCYDKGTLVQASTRGDGMIGEDVTHNAKTIENIPKTIPFQGKLTVVGEGVIHFDDFEKMNNEMIDKKYKHPRNLASGSIRQLSNKECEKRNVHFYAFGIVSCDSELPDSKIKRLGWLNEMGFSLAFCTSSTDTSIQNLDYYINTLARFSREKHLPIDGIVISFDSIYYGESLGCTSHHPLHSIAFKFEDEIAKTKLIDIEWSCGKTSITPVALFEEVDIDGTNVSRASIHNISILEVLELGIGDSIGVIKANMIIPQVTENYTRSNNIVVPKLCPCCGELTDIKQDNESKVLVCTNENCPAKMLKKLAHFVSRDAMNIEGLSEATLEKFVESGIIKTFSDIYKISNFENTIINMDGFGLKSYNKIIEAIEKSKTTDFNRIIYSMSIPLIGRSASKTIEKKFNHDMDSFLNAICTCYDFSELDDFGNTMNDSIQKWCDYSLNLRELSEVLDFLIIKIPVSKADSSLKDLTGLIFCCTGEFETFKRKDLEDIITNSGGKLSGSVSKKTTMLITNDKTSGSKKNKDAEKNNVPIMNELEFRNYIGL